MMTRLMQSLKKKQQEKGPDPSNKAVPYKRFENHFKYGGDKMASLSASFIMNDIHKKINAKKESALRLSLLSIFSGSIHPLIMLDIKEADTKPVVFSACGNS